MKNRELNLILLLLEGYDIHNKNHAEKTSKLAESIGLKMDLNSSDLNLLKKGALLHDIGKLMIPHDILNKPDKIDNIEKEVISAHPVIGANLLEEAGYEKEVVEIAKFHHEWWDGSGYPDGLKEDEIPLLAQIISVVSAYDVMTSKKIYSYPKNKEEVYEELKNFSGIQFSPNIVEVFLDYLDKN